MNTELKQFIEKHIKEDTDTNKLSVLSLPCGVGKSEYIKYLLAEAIQTNKGLIVVTDSVERLNDYVTNGQDDYLVEYIQRNLNRVSILTSDTLSKEVLTLSYKPIILMTTQRYFNLDKDEIIKLTTGSIKRDRIIFDEKVYLLESRKLTVKSLNDIATALREGLDNTVVDGDKQWLISQYDQLNSILQQRLRENEELNNNTANFRREVFFDADGLKISVDDVKFKILISKYKALLRRYNPDVLKDLQAIDKLLIDGAITSQKVKSKLSNQEYQNYFTVVINNIDKLIDVGAKVYVMDGTADISPEYKLNCVDMIDCTPFKKDLSKLTINIVNVNTSKGKLTTKGSKTDNLIKSIIDYIKSDPQAYNTVFTYQSIEHRFKDQFKNVNHFGNIKGSNHYRDITNICQVGLNRWSELIYVLYANEIGRCNDLDRSLIKRIYDTETIDRIRCNLILADIEQNIYRCRIRNNDNKHKCNYMLMFNTTEKSRLFKDYQPLVTMIKRRYKPLGATINVIDAPTEFKLLKSKERNQETNTKKILRWLSANKGNTFYINNMLLDLNLTQKQFKRTKEKDLSIKQLFETMKTNKRGYYIVK